MIEISENALQYIRKCQSESGQPDEALRISVVGGGCSGLSYKMEFKKEPLSSDKTFDISGVRVFIDAKSYLYIKGLTLDYSGGLNGTGFTFKNPNATKSCGCGTSFSVNE